MKTRLTSLVFFAVFSNILFGQPPTKEISHYVLPEFINGTVLMKNGTKHQTLLNYNVATEEMIFDQNGQKLAFTDFTLSQLDTVYLEERKFVLGDDGKFAEIIHYGDYQLFAKYKAKVIPPGKPAAYGGTSQTSSSDSYSSWLSSGQMYQLKLPDDFKVNPYIVYHFSNGEDSKDFLSMRQIKRYYNKKKERFNLYMKDNKVDFDKPASVSALFEFMQAK